MVFEDHRGSFLEFYRRSEFLAGGIADVFVQDNYSRSLLGVLRGLHYQKNPKAQAKLIMALRGEVFDVAVDIRKGSPYYGRWIGVILSEERKQMIYIPAGFAHGFCVLSKEAELVYKATNEYDPQLDRGMIWNDSTIGVDWPIQSPIVSKKDSRLPSLQEADNDFIYERGVSG
jgi:dTDP-4-dehydrorhamnose 3,5-epimerase